MIEDELFSLLLINKKHLTIYLTFIQVNIRWLVDKTQVLNLKTM